MYAGYFPMGLSLERIFTELPRVPLRDEVWPRFLRDNARRVLGLDDTRRAGPVGSRPWGSTSRSAGSARRPAGSWCPPRMSGSCASGATPTTRCRGATPAPRAGRLPAWHHDPARLDRPRLQGSRRLVGRAARRPRRRARPGRGRGRAPTRSPSTWRPGSPTTRRARWPPAPGWRRWGARRSTRRSPSTTPRCSWRRSWSPATRCSTRSGTRRNRAWWCSSGPTRWSPTGTGPRSRTRSGASGTSGRPAARCGCSTLAGPRPPHWPTATSRCGPAATSPSSPRWRGRCWPTAPTTPSCAGTAIPARSRPCVGPSPRSVSSRAAAEAGVELADLEELARADPLEPGRLAVFCGTGTTMARDGVAGGVAALGPAGRHRFARPPGRHAVQPGRGEPAGAARPGTAPRSTGPPADPGCRGSSGRCRRRRSPTRSRRGTCAPSS